MIPNPPTVYKLYAILRYEGVLYASKSQLDQNVTLSSFVSNDVIEAKTLIAMSLTLFVGIFQVEPTFHLRPPKLR